MFGPTLARGRGYERKWLFRDVLAALTIIAVLVPQGLAYGELAGLSPVNGLYAALLPLLLYPLVSSSRRLMVGPESGLAILTAAALAPMAAGDPARYVLLAGMLSLMVGVIMLAAGALRLGFMADFLSHPVLVGFMNGVAVILIVSQLGRFFGVSASADSTPETLWAVLGALGDISWETTALGCVLLVVLFIASKLGPRVPGALLTLVIAVIAVKGLGLDGDGVAIVGDVPSGLPGLSYPAVGLGAISELLPAAAMLALVGFSQGILTARAFAEKHGEEVDADRELLAMGLANLGAGVSQGFPTSASQSRTAVAETAGMKTQFAQVLAGIGVAIFLLLFTGILHDVPQVALAAIVIFSSIGLFDLLGFRKLYRKDRMEFGIAVAAFASVIIFGILVGILLAVFLSLTLLIAGMSRPHDAVLGPVDGVDGFHEIDLNAAVTEAAPGVIVYRFDGPLFFANADYFLGRALSMLDGHHGITHFIFNVEVVSTIDVTASKSLKVLYRELDERGIKLLLARTSIPLRRQLVFTGVLELIGADSIYPTVRTAVAAAVSGDVGWAD
jgi:SulP family sulfate permease